jgi:hypothetical protein
MRHEVTDRAAGLLPRSFEHVGADQEMSSETGASSTRSLHYAELTTRGAVVGRAGEVLHAKTRWVAFEDLASWPAALAANVDPRTVVRIRFPTDAVKRPGGVDVELFVLPASESKTG